jgi:hypothetical protein
VFLKKDEALHLTRCDEGVPRTGEKIRWIKTEVSFSGVYQPPASSERLPITARILRFGRMLAWGRGPEMMRGATAPQHDFAAGLRAGERSGGLPSSSLADRVLLPKLPRVIKRPIYET